MREALTRIVNVKVSESVCGESEGFHEKSEE